MEETKNNPFIIAVGASAGGLEALQEFLGNCPAELKNACIIIAQHLSPTHKSMLVQLLSRGTKLTVEEAADGAKLESGTVYITPPDAEISVQNFHICICRPLSGIGPKPSVDVLFRSLAESHPHLCIAVILSGTGSDGAAGIRSVKNAGGYVIIQEPQTAKYDGMPRTSIETGCYHVILPAKKIGVEIAEYIADPQSKISAQSVIENEPTLTKIFKILARKTGTNFSAYKPTTICRRLEKRISMLKMNSIDEYWTYFEKNPQESDELFNLILIGVTSFFRDEDAFSSLKVHFEEYLKSKQERPPLRVWVPGASTGEEAYSVAMMILEILGDKIGHFNLQIFATDVDENAINIARRGVFAEDSVKNLPKNLIQKYFIKNTDSYELNKNLRSFVLFSKHDLTCHPPFLKLDLICCRNLLIYFGAELQKQIFPIFHYALLNKACLFLGKSETIGQFTDLFAPLDSQNKIFQKKPGTNISAVRFAAFKHVKNTNLSIAHAGINPKPEKKNSLGESVRQTIFDTFEHPYLIVNEAFDLIEIRGDVRLYMSLPSGAMQINALKLVNQELQTELRSLLSQTAKERRPVKSKIKKFLLFERVFYVRMSVLPMPFPETEEVLYLVVFENLDIEEFIQKNEISDQAVFENARVLELEQELAAVKEHLQTYIEELETSNEELQSLNEEMQSTNEELQSSNEELETSNEELQSTNEEVQVAYAELKSVNEELHFKELLLHENQSNLNALLDNQVQAFILADLGYNIMLFNQKTRSFFEFFNSEKFKVGASMIDCLDSDLIELFVKKFKIAATGENTFTEFCHKKGKNCESWFNFNFMPVFNIEKNVKAVSVGIMDITDIKIAHKNINNSEKRLASVFNVVSVALCVLDEKANFTEINDFFTHILGYEKADLPNLNLLKLFPNEMRISSFLEFQKLFANEKFQTENVKMLCKSGKILDVHLSSETLTLSDGSRFQILSIRDVTESLKSWKNLKDTADIARVGSWEVDLIENKVIFSDITRAIHELSPDAPQPLLNECINFYKEGENRERIARFVQNAIQKGESFDDIFEFVTAKGNFIWVRARGQAEFVSGKCVKVIGVFQDISREKNLTEKLADSEQNFEQAFEYSTQAKAIFNENLICERVNVKFCQLLGYSVEDMTGMEYKNLFFGGEYLCIAEVSEILKAKKQRNFTFDVRLRKKDGGEVWTVFSVSFIENYQRTKISFLLQINDVGEKITLFNELRESNFRFSKLAEATSDAVWDWDIDRNTLFWGKGFETFFGFSSDVKPSYDFWLENVHPDNLSDIKKRVKEALAGKETRSVNYYRFRHTDGHFLDIEDRSVILRRNDGTPYRVIGAMSDITKVKQRERELLLFKAIVESAKDGILVTSANPSIYPGPEIAYVNEAKCKMTGYLKEELIGNTPRILQGLKSDRRTIDKIAQAVRKRQTFETEIINYKKNGDEFWNNFSVVPIFDEKGNHTHWISVSRDITELKKAFEEKEQLVEELAAHNNELKQFSYITSHNMRAPLTNILAIFDLIDRESLAGTETLEWIEAMQISAENLNQTLNELIQILIIKESRSIASEFIRFEDSLNRVRRSIDEMLKSTGTQINVNFYQAKEVFFNKSYLDSILLNFLTNSVKYAVPGKKAEINIYSQIRNNQVQLIVQDNGLGFDMKQAEGRIFGLYQTFHKHTESKGIGLYLVHSQITALGGKIEVSSEVNIGTVFTITFKNP